MSETLYIIDAYAQIFRAYYAIRNGMRSPVTSEPTHAVFGFTAMLIKLFDQFKPHYVVVAKDMPGPTFRDEIYAQYKATRVSTPEDLIAQIPRVFEVAEAFGIPIFGVPGIEADDVIATIIQRVLDNPAYADVQVRIVSKDKDLEQLLCDRVAMFDIHTDTLIDVPALYASKGIRPDQVVDYLSLLGDSVDNIPGVAGVGEKTAQALLRQFGSIEGILEHVDEIEVRNKDRVRAALLAARDTLPITRELVRLKRDADLAFSLEDARVSPIDLGRLLPLFQQLGFNRFQDEVRRLAAAETDHTGSPAPAAVAPPAEAPSDNLFDQAPATIETEPVDYRCVTTLERLEELAATLRAQTLIAVDTETTGLQRDARLCGLSFAWEPGHAAYVPALSPEADTHLNAQAVLDVLGPILADASIGKCGHNLKFDARVLLHHGVALRGVVCDTMLAATLMDPSAASQKLDALALAHLNWRMRPITELLGGGDGQRSMADVPLDRVTPYAAEDADIALRLCHALLPQIEAMGMGSLLRDVESPLTTVLAEMEWNGILCDPVELRRQGEALQARVDELRKQIWAAAGTEFQIDSPRQLADVLFDRLGLASTKKTKTGRSTDIEVLEKLAAQEDVADPRTSVPRLVIEYRQLQKLIGTYLTALAQSIDPKTGRIHTTFHQLVTATGRLASQGPNLQNIPVRTDVGRQVRKAFKAPTGCALICADYSQIELRILAHLSEDPALLEAFQLGQDIHTAVASQVFGVPPEQVTREMRSHAKTINFGIIYGVTAYGLARRIEGMDVEAAGALIADYRNRFAGIDRFLQQCVQQALSQGYVSTFMGRRRAIPEVRSSNGNQRALGERLAINTVVQGSAADLMKLAMVRVQRRIDRDRLPVRMLLQIHDELVLESPEEEAPEYAAIVREEMENAMTLRVPLQAEIGVGPDWLSAK